jgi:hypothetical protein
MPNKSLDFFLFGMFDFRFLLLPIFSQLPSWTSESIFSPFVKKNQEELW